MVEDEEPRKVVLLDYRLEGLSVDLGAEIDAAGDLILEGQDLGAFVEDFWGDGEYEYWIVVRAGELDRVVRALDAESVEGSPMASADDEARVEPVLDRLRRSFAAGLFKSSSELREWMKARGIAHDFESRA